MVCSVQTKNIHIQVQQIARLKQTMQMNITCEPFRTKISITSKKIQKLFSLNTSTQHYYLKQNA